MRNAPSLIRILLTVVVVVAALLAAHSMWQRNQMDPWTRDGRVRADVVQVAPDVSGWITDVLVKDNQTVHKGQPLLIIDRARYQIALAQAAAAVDSQRAALDQAAREDRRNRALGTLVSTEITEQARSRVAQLRTALAQAQANADLSALNLERTMLRAPVDGVVSNMELRAGDYVTAGHQALALVYLGSLHVDGYFEETKMAAVSVGDPATIKLMGVADTLSGHVESIAGGVEDRERASGSAMLANVNPTFSWVRLAQRIPVRVAIDHVPPGLRLIPGQTATVIVQPRTPPTVRRTLPW